MSGPAGEGSDRASAIPQWKLRRRKKSSCISSRSVPAAAQVGQRRGGSSNARPPGRRRSTGCWRRQPRRGAEARPARPPSAAPGRPTRKERNRRGGAARPGKPGQTTLKMDADSTTQPALGLPQPRAGPAGASALARLRPDSSQLQREHAGRAHLHSPQVRPVRADAAADAPLLRGRPGGHRRDPGQEGGRFPEGPDQPPHGAGHRQGAAGERRRVVAAAAAAHAARLSPAPPAELRVADGGRHRARGSRLARGRGPQRPRRHDGRDDDHRRRGAVRRRRRGKHGSRRPAPSPR